MDLMQELLKRGVSFKKANMMLEAVYSCAIEGAEIPKTSKDVDRLVELLS
jgi:hypothetical protein